MVRPETTDWGTIARPNDDRLAVLDWQFRLLLGAIAGANSKFLPAMERSIRGQLATASPSPIERVAMQELLEIMVDLNGPDPA